jgi:hypothetical protein
MTQEEKAKRYDELLLKLQKAKVDDNVCDEMYYRVIDNIVPELAKSEDEKIRKAIHIYFDWLDGRKDYAPKGEYTIRDMIAWLEKQGEQKQDPCDNCKDVRLNCHNFPCVKKRAFKQGKSALEVINEEDVDNANNDRGCLSKGYYWGFKAGAKWQAENLWKPADGDDLPEIDREVIAILDNGKVVFAHRPPEYWDGKDIVTGKITRNYPKTYGKGGWNIPNLKYWLDYPLPE